MAASAAIITYLRPNRSDSPPTVGLRIDALLCSVIAFCTLLIGTPSALAISGTNAYVKRRAIFTLVRATVRTSTAEKIPRAGTSGARGERSFIWPAVYFLPWNSSRTMILR